MHPKLPATVRVSLLQVLVHGEETGEVMEGTEQLPLGEHVDEVIRDASAAIRLEIEAQISASADLIELTDGRQIGTTGAQNVWSFGLSNDSSPEVETPGQLILATGESAQVRILAVGDSSLILATVADLGESIDDSTLVLQVGFVFQALVERLDSLHCSPDCHTDLFDELLFPDVFADDGGGEIPGSEPPNAEEEQQRAASRAIEPGVRFTWGPPGTGKTTVLARAVALAVERGDTVLVLSTANAAVDVAIDRIAQELGDTALLANGQILRVGTPQTKAVLDRPEVLPEMIASRLRPDLAESLTDLQRLRPQLSDRARASDEPEELKAVTRQLEELRKEQERLEKSLAAERSRIIADSSVVTTTLARAVISDEIWDKPFDLVIVDEASMAPLPFVLALALRGATTLSLFGDFRQLPPIAVSPAVEARNWFARDVFDYASVIEGHEAGLIDPRLTVLRTQFRMGEQICATVNDFAYDGILRTHSSARNRAVRLAELAPAPSCELVLVDIAPLQTVCAPDRQPDSYSRANLLSAALAASVGEVLLLGGCESVGLISPYRAQSSLTSALASHQESLDAATIHRFQGSERDAIIFDLTDSTGVSSPSRLTGKGNSAEERDYVRRLLTVAVSRARGKLFLFADLEFVERHFPLGSPVSALIEMADAAGAEHLSSLQLVQESWLHPVPDSPLKWSGNFSAAAAALCERARKDSRIELNLPEGLLETTWLTELVGRSTRPELITVRCTRDLAADLADSGANIRLGLVGNSPWAVLGRKRLFYGSADYEKPAVALTSSAAVSAFRRIISPTDRGPDGLSHS